MKRGGDEGSVILVVGGGGWWWVVVDGGGWWSAWAFEGERWTVGKVGGCLKACERRHTKFRLKCTFLLKVPKLTRWRGPKSEGEGLTRIFASASADSSAMPPMVLSAMTTPSSLEPPITLRVVAGCSITPRNTLLSKS